MLAHVSHRRHKTVMAQTKDSGRGDDTLAAYHASTPQAVPMAEGELSLAS